MIRKCYTMISFKNKSKKDSRVWTKFKKKKNSKEEYSFWMLGL